MNTVLSEKKKAQKDTFLSHLAELCRIIKSEGWKQVRGSQSLEEVGNAINRYGFLLGMMDIILNAVVLNGYVSTKTHLTKHFKWVTFWCGTYISSVFKWS